MQELWASGHLVDVALAATVLEIAVLVAWRRRAPAGLRPMDVVGQLLAGSLLLIALRFAVTGAPWWIPLGLMAASLPAHLWDLKRRARRVEGEESPSENAPGS